MTRPLVDNTKLEKEVSKKTSIAGRGGASIGCRVSLVCARHCQLSTTARAAALCEARCTMAVGFFFDALVTATFFFEILVVQNQHGRKQRHDIHEICKTRKHSCKTRKYCKTCKYQIKL